MTEDMRLTVAKEITLAAIAKVAAMPVPPTNSEEVGKWAGGIFKAVYKEVVSTESFEPPKKPPVVRQY
jgi:hypothetical protein